MKIIDAHNHPDWHAHDLNRFLDNMDKYGIQKTWLLSWECPEHEYGRGYKHVVPAPLLGSNSGPIPFERCISYKERAPERFIIGYAPDPRDPDALAKMRAAVEIYGAKICGELKIRMMYDAPDAIMLFRLCGDLGVPVTLHMQYDNRKNYDSEWCEWWGGSIETLENMLRLCPETNFLGHAPGFWNHISEDELSRVCCYPRDKKVQPGGKISELLKKYPNLYCDISAGSGHCALARDVEFTKKFLVEFQDRVLYARDYFDNIHQELLNSLGLPQDVLEKIYHGNAEKLVPDA